ncbi:MAG: hypothetical protein KAH18_04810 [Psychromonas sp.]|nr:hypothetical protein [Psychromonas sp.]
MNYKQLTSRTITNLRDKKSGKCPKEIADDLNRSPSSISGALKRNKGRRGYRPLQANELSKQRRKIAFKASKLTTEVTGCITI